MTKWSKEDVLTDLKRVNDIDGNLTRSSYRKLGKIATSTIDSLFGNFSTAKKRMHEHYFEQEIMKIIHKNKNLIDLETLCDILDTSPKKVKEALNKLIKKGYSIKLKKNQLTVDKIPVISILKKQKINLKPVNNKIRFAVVSDTHLAGTHECLDELHFFYKTAHEDYGVTNFFHCGDLVAGVWMYRGQENELKFWGADKQVAYVVKNYPRITGVTTHFITGNHDLCYLNNAGKDIGIDIANMRPDMHYLGQYLARVELGPVKIELHHFDKIPGSALSSPLQSTIAATPDHDKPDFLFCGHLHQKVWLELRGINAFLAGCFEHQSLWLKRKKLYPVIGGFIVEVGLDNNGKIRTVMPTFVNCGS